MATSSDVLVFISKATEDHELAMETVRLVEDAGLRAWVTPRDIPAGADHAKAIGEVIPDCAAMIVLLSPVAAERTWVNNEVESAITHSVRLFPVAVGSFIDNLDGLPTAMRTRLATFQIRADGDLAATVNDVIRAVKVSSATSSRASRPARKSPRRTSRAASAGEQPRITVAADQSEVFVGEDRVHILHGLQEAWREVVSGGESRMIVLLGETGFGKTRIVQEFYQHLAASQSQPAFWPATLAQAGGGQRGLQRSRKRVAPLEISPQEGSNADFLWLGHAVDEGHEGRADFGLVALAESLSQVLAAACACAPESAAADMARAALGGSTSVDASALLRLLQLGTRSASESLAQHGSVEAFWGGVQVLWSGGGLPLVVVVEDGHYAGEPTIALLEQLVTVGGMQALAIVCAQESKLGGGGAGPRQPLGRLLDANLRQVETVRLTRLTESETARIVRQALPDMDGATLQEFVTKVDGNPYYAHTLLLEMVRAARQGRLDTAWVRNRPGTFEDELRLQWRDLDDDVRQVLSGLAVLGTQVPERMGLHALSAAMPHSADQPLSASLGSGWLRRLRQENLLRFLERPRWLIANEESYEEWSDSDRRRIIQRALTTLEAMAHDTGLRDPLLQELHVLLALSADEQAVPFDRATAVRSGVAGSERLFLAYDDSAVLKSAERTERLVTGHESAPGMAAVAVLSAIWLRNGLFLNLNFGSTRAQVRSAADTAVERGMNVADTRPDLTAWALAMKSRAHRVQFDEEQMAIALDYATRAEEYLSLSPAASALVAADVMESNAMVAFATGNFTTAAELTEQRLATLRTSGLEHDRLVQRAQQDRGFYWARVDVHRALRSREEVYLQQAQLWGGVRHRQVAIAAKELVHSLVRSGAQGDCARGFNLAEEALHWYQTVTGTRHQDTRRTRGIWCLAAYRLSDELEHAGDAAGSAQLRSDALTAAKLNVELATQDDTPERKASYRSRLAQALVRNFDPAGVQILREDLPVRCGETHFSDSEWPRADDPLSIEILWDVAELVAALHRFGEATEASDLVRRFGLEQVDDWPPYLTRGWRSTRPEHARAGVL